jgi:hypothetical protein
VPLDRSLADRLRPGESWGRGCLFGVARLGGSQAYWWASARTAEGTGGSPAEEEATVERRFGVWHDPIPELACRLPGSFVTGLRSRTGPGDGPLFASRTSKRSSEASYDQAAATRLWRVSADLVGLTAAG